MLIKPLIKIYTLIAVSCHFKDRANTFVSSVRYKLPKMKDSLVLFVSILALTSGFRDSRIVNGREMEVGDGPNMVAILVTTSETIYFCGGSLISANYVLTAAYCMDGYESLIELIP